MPPTSDSGPAPERIDRFRGAYAFLSNFHHAPFQWQSQVWNTAEAAFQGQKTLHALERERIRKARSPAAAKRLGRRVDLRPDWEHVKDDVMRSILQAKFTLPELRDALLATGDAELVEGNDWGDTYWGVYCGHGRNRLGQTLMRIRDGIRKRAGSAMDAQHAAWLRAQCERERNGRCGADHCWRRAGWRRDADGPSCIPLEILRRLEAVAGSSTTP